MQSQYNIHSAEWSQLSGIAADDKYCDEESIEEENEKADDESEEEDG